MNRHGEGTVMASEFPRSPRILKGALVAYQLPDLIPSIIVFQYNPEEVSRNLQGRSTTGGGRGDAGRTNGPPSETISLSRSEEHTSEIQSLMRISYAVFCLKKKKKNTHKKH